MADSAITDIKELDCNQLGEWLACHNIRPFRAGQILRWIYHRQVDSFDEMTDVGKSLRQVLSQRFTIGRLTRVQLQVSADGSRKYLFRLVDGNLIESVLIPERDHYTLCISSQVGCAQGCRFCLTAAGGLRRNLTGGEIVAQVRDISRDLEGPMRLTNLVFMGMGEPLANYKNVRHALTVLLDANAGLGFARRRITVSTAGLVPGMKRFGNDFDVNLAVSLNAANNDTRSRIMPINRRYPIESLIDTCRHYPLRPHSRITFEYVLLHGVNDSQADARRLAALLRPIRSKINLIPYNPHAGSRFRRPSETRILAFQEFLIQHHYTTIIRRSKGEDISAACGQLRAERLTEK